MQYSNQYVAQQDPFNDPFFQRARENFHSQYGSQAPVYTSTTYYQEPMTIATHQPLIQDPYRFHSVFITPPEVPEDEEYTKALREYDELRQKLEDMEKNLLDLHKKAVERQRERSQNASRYNLEQSGAKIVESQQLSHDDSRQLAKDFDNMRIPNNNNNYHNNIQVPISRSTIHTENSMGNSRQKIFNNTPQRNYPTQSPMSHSNQHLRPQQQNIDVPQRSSFYESFEKTDTYYNERGERVVVKKTETNQDGDRLTQVHEQIFDADNQLLSDNIWTEKPSNSNSKPSTLNQIPTDRSK